MASLARKLAGVYPECGPNAVRKVSAAGMPELQTAPPLDFDGPGDAWSPEHLLLAAVETCFLFTLRSVASASKLEFLLLELSGQGKVDRKDGATHEIVLRPRLRLSVGADKDRALRILEKSEKACLVSASLSTPVRLDAEVLVGSVTVSRIFHPSTP